MIKNLDNYFLTSLSTTDTLTDELSVSERDSHKGETMKRDQNWDHDRGRDNNNDRKYQRLGSEDRCHLKEHSELFPRGAGDVWNFNANNYATDRPTRPKEMCVKIAESATLEVHPSRRAEAKIDTVGSQGVDIKVTAKERTKLGPEGPKLGPELETEPDESREVLEPHSSITDPQGLMISQSSFKESDTPHSLKVNDRLTKDNPRLTNKLVKTGSSKQNFHFQ